MYNKLHPMFLDPFQILQGLSMQPLYSYPRQYSLLVRSHDRRSVMLLQRITPKLSDLAFILSSLIHHEPTPLGPTPHDDAVIQPPEYLTTQPINLSGIGCSQACQFQKTTHQTHKIHDINFVVVCADSHNPYRRRDLHWMRFIVHETKQKRFGYTTKVYPISTVYFFF